MDLFRPEDQIPRFTVHILDQKLKGSNGKFAVFIVPQGRLVLLSELIKRSVVTKYKFPVKPSGYFQRHKVEKSFYYQLSTNVWLSYRCIVVTFTLHGKPNSY